MLRADEHDHGGQEQARQALEQGRVLPLRTVLNKIERDYQGQALKVEFEVDDGRFLYKIRLLQSDGRMVKLKVDAVDGKVLEIKRKEHGRDRDAHPRR
ncbi:MAG: PepSY domain-containing protein [Giesbergeria sp.]